MNSRLIAAHILHGVFNEGQTLTAALENGLAAVATQQDRAFVQALCYGVVRYYYRLDFVLSRLLHKPLKDADVRMLALLGLYQLGYLRVKPHAAVAETVAAMRRHPGAKALLNALLRNYLRQQQELEAAAESDASANTLHPLWLLRRIQHDWPQQAETIVAANNQHPPLTLRVNVLQGSRNHYLECLEAHQIAARASPYCDTALELEAPIGTEQLPDFSAGSVSVQDGAAQLAAGLLELRPGQRVLDICAAPGGKTAHILETEPRLQELWALDIDARRLQRVRDNLQRLGLQARLLAADASRPDVWWDGQTFERILVDAPCSALGVIRRHPDIKVLRRAGDVAQLESQQSQILDAAWSVLASGGILLYATCSILKQENEIQIAAFLARHGDAVELPIAAAWGQVCTHGRQILPGDGSGMDGFYYARLQKR